MKILKISGKNVASLAGEFCVDFEMKPLASAGLFAISGPTGAGKSTLLDTLCLALYDATPRLPKVRSGSYLPDVGTETVAAHDSRTLLRRGASEACAEVDFVGNDEVRYRARWHVRRSRGKTGGPLQKVQMSLHRLPELTALGGTNTEVLKEIVQRVGLSFDQFTRAVLLAQNEFSAFLNTEENDRGALLETLTGSAVYSALSKRAYERYQTEKSVMQQLSARLADHTPLAGKARCALEGECSAADAALALADAQKTVLEQLLRWHQEADKLRENEAQAEAALALAQAAVASALERRRRLDTRDAVEPARSLQADRVRLERECAALDAAMDAAAIEQARTLAALEQAGTALDTAVEALRRAELHQAASAPMLDQAKALDAGIGALAPSHAKARQVLAAAHATLATADNAVTTAADKLAATQSAHAEVQAWLASYMHHRELSLQWPRWETLLAQAATAAALEMRIAGERDAAGIALMQAQESDQKTADALAAAASLLASAEATRQLAISALAAYDTERLRSERDALELRREELTGAEKHWGETLATQRRLEHARAQTAAHAAAHAEASATIACAASQAPGLKAALDQSERSLKVAELACAGSVVDLRATLEDGAPCPVCGSAEHPYQHQNSALQDMLARLRDEVARCREAFQVNASTIAAQRALLAGYAQHLTAAREEAVALQDSLELLRATWNALPLAAEAVPEPDRSAWLARELDAVRERSKELDRHESAARQASRARDAAQQACDHSAAEQAGAQAQAISARASLAHASAHHAALLDKHTQAREHIERLLDALDSGVGMQRDWRAQWQAGPAQFHAAREAEANRWREQSAQQARVVAALAALESDASAAGERRLHLQLARDAAALDFSRIDADISAKTTQRAAIWGGRAVRDMEQEMATAVNAARAALAQQHSERHLAAQAHARVAESQVQLQQRLAAQREHARAADAALSAWLASYPERHPLLEPVSSGAELASLLAFDGAALAQERARLLAIDTAAATALTVLAERRNQRALHQQSAPPEEASVVAAQLQALNEARKEAHDTATALRLQLAQDNVRRDNAQAMMVEIEKQQLVEQRWGRMNELIGSADGKKFRNYAQQFTLDVLLGYANSHLHHLAKRYRLERIVAPSGPSLGLMVRDQDMGGEVRSVNSLSGGESFLVSLALALGLASLSSNRVRVESLFIDEGFGSLDSETLRVAMDALDGLQSMGRKVGVISHVQEMTERIATRIIVQPAGGGTSSVRVQ